MSVIDEIPARFWDMAEILVVDNCSTDNTLSEIESARESGRWPGPIQVIQPEKNLGYSGSQKLVYKLVVSSEVVDRVLMLHGDGQYPPALLGLIEPHLDDPAGLVYGYRDKSSFPDEEETPRMTYWIIKTLSAIESAVTGHNRKEWHTGFVMYSKEFLSRVNLDALTDTYHIDGHLQFVSGELDEPVKAIPIWKRYADYEQLKGLNRLTYIVHVLRLMVQFRIQGWDAVLPGTDAPENFRIIK